MNVVGKRKVTWEEMRSLQLRMMDCIHEYCMQNGLRYSLGGGSLLGAIRHKGFIPWDDDVDVMLPRADYDKFIKGFAGKYEHAAIHNYENDKSYAFLFAKIYDDRTLLEEEWITRGVYVDVFPIDGMPAENKSKWYFWKLVHEIWAFQLHAKKWKDLQWKEKIMRIIYPFKDRIWRKAEKRVRSYDFETSECTGCALGAYNQKELMGKDTFKHYIDLEFEGRTYRGIADYDAYLTKHYGNYMELPPEKERKGHGYVFWWR
ncbi:MAG: LicD family protein [Bacteroidales bacterium]|nr:LicD family protein [Bacteroidales bacterium]